MFLLIAALAIQSPFTSMRAYSKEVVCPDSVTLGLWNAVNELAGAIPGIDTLSKLAIQGSKVFQKETGNSCSMNMENLLRLMAEIATSKINEDNLRKMTVQWEGAVKKFNEGGDYPSESFLESSLSGLESYELESADLSFEVKPVLTGISVLKLATMKLLIINADKRFDDRFFTNSERIYTMSARMFNAVQVTKHSLFKMEQKFDEYAKKTEVKMDQVEDEYSWNGQIYVQYGDGTKIWGPEAEVTKGFFSPGKVNDARNKLKQEGDKFLEDEKRIQKEVFYDATYKEIKDNIDKIYSAAEDTLNRRNFAFEKVARTDGVLSESTVNGIRNSYNFATEQKLLNWSVDLGEQFPATPQGIESIAFKAAVGGKTMFTINIQDKNRKPLKFKTIDVAPNKTDYVINFRNTPYDSGLTISAARYVTIKSAIAIRSTLHEVYVFTNNIAPTMVATQSSTTGNHLALNAIDNRKNDQDLSWCDTTFSRTSANKNEMNSWSALFNKDLKVATVLVTLIDGGYYPNDYYKLELINSNNQVVSSRHMIPKGGTTYRWNVEFPSGVKYANRLKISSVISRTPIALADVQIYKMGDSNNTIGNGSK